MLQLLGKNPLDCVIPILIQNFTELSYCQVHTTGAFSLNRGLNAEIIYEWVRLAALQITSLLPLLYMHVTTNPEQYYGAPFVYCLSWQLLTRVLSVGFKTQPGPILFREDNLSCLRTILGCLQKCSALVPDC